MYWRFLLGLALVVYLGVPLLPLRAQRVSGETLRPAQHVEVSAPDGGSPPFAAGRVLVQVSDGAAGPHARLAAADLGATWIEEPPGFGLEVLRVEPGREEEVARRLSGLPGVAYAEPDYLVRIHDLPAAGGDRPVLTSPDTGAVLRDFAPTFTWSLPPGARVYHLQVTPANNDGPGIDVIGEAAAFFAIPAAPAWYGLLPDMTYSWRLRSNPMATWSELDPSWGPWSDAATFRTPAASASGLSPAAPWLGATVEHTTPLLRWTDSNAQVFYYELQLSADARFTTDPATATAAVYWLLVHGGVTAPSNSLRVPAAYPLTRGETYHWRVRPRVQGDGTPVEWSPSWSFTVGAGAAPFTEPVTPQSPALTATPTPAPVIAPDDPYYPAQWNLAKVNALAAWEISKGHAGIGVAVIDSGVDFLHPDLKGKLAAGENCVEPGRPPEDANGHGTHVAGTIAGLANNGIGIAGLAPSTIVMPFKAVGANGWGTTSCIIAGINYALEAGAKVINLSVGGPKARSLEHAVRRAHEQGVLVVSSSGNCGWNDAAFDPGCDYKLNALSYPAGFPWVLSVGATGPADERSAYSSYGPHLRVTAPGGNSRAGARTPQNSVLSTCWRNSLRCGVGQAYTAMEGTSMAAPHVAALASLIWAVRPELTNDQVAHIIESTATDLGAPGRDDHYGKGRIDALAAVRMASSSNVPTVPPPTPTPWATSTPTPTATAGPQISFGPISFGVNWPSITRCEPSGMSDRFPAGTDGVFYAAQYTGEGEYQRRWYRNGTLLSTATAAVSGPSGCAAASLEAPAGSVLGPGEYVLELWVEGRLQQRRGFTVLAPAGWSPTPVPLLIGLREFGTRLIDDRACQLGGTGSTFPHGATRIYFRFDHQGTGRFSTLWTRDGTPVSEIAGPFSLTRDTGCAWGYLEGPGGSALPAGAYRLEVRIEGGATRTTGFQITPPAALSTATPTVPPESTPTPAAEATATGTPDPTPEAGVPAPVPPAPSATPTPATPATTPTPGSTPLPATATASSTPSASPVPATSTPNSPVTGTPAPGG